MDADNLFPNLPILMVDDQPAWLRSMAMALKASVSITNIHKCSNSLDVKKLLANNSYSLVLLDLTMPNLGGEELLQFIAEKYPEIPIIIISGLNQIETAIHCVKLGAEDFYVKTDDHQRIAAGILRVLNTSQLRQENNQLSRQILAQEQHISEPAFSAIVTNSSKMIRVFSYLTAIANSHEPTLIVGESGTGKELIARALHQLRCPNKPWVAVNVAGLDDIAFSDTLFGHIKGAFTDAQQNRKGMIESAGEGTLFLDEIGDLSLPSQVKLLRLLQEGEYYPLGSDIPKKIKANIVVTTNRDLHERALQGQFRHDLRYRLSTHRVELPPLRERLDDLPKLVEFFMAETAQSLGKNQPKVLPELISLLNSYHFPGNIRELRAIIFDAVSVYDSGEKIQNHVRLLLAKKERTHSPSGNSSTTSNKIIFLETLPTIKESNHLLIQEAMQRAKGKQAVAAQLLGISRQALNQRLIKKR